MPTSQKGLAPILLLLLAALAVIAYIFITSTFPFKDKLFSLLFPKPPSHAQEAQSVPDEILLKFKNGVNEGVKVNIRRHYGLKKIDEISQIGVERGKVPQKVRDLIIEALKKNPAIQYAEPNFLVKSQFSPNDPYFSFQWAPVKISALQAWDITQGSPNVTIAILDTGIYVSHPDLVGKVLNSVDFSGSTSTNDVYGHGTHVAGIAGMATNNSIGMAGIGFNSTLDNVKVLGDTGGGTSSTVANGIVWAADNGTKVINMSLGGTSDSSTMQDAVNYAWNKGIVLAAAACNNTSSAPCYPAADQNVIAVAATQTDDTLIPSSNYGSWVAVVAPGGSVISTINTGSYSSMSGTSMASPHVAAEAALIMAANPKLTNQQIVDIITSSVDNAGKYNIGPSNSGGRINVAKALQVATGATPSATPSPSPSPTPSPSPSPTPSDTTPPNVSVTSPSNDATVSGTVNISASSSDNVSISSVSIFVDGNVVNICTVNSSSGTCSYSWDSIKVSNGSHTIYASALDSSNNQTTSTTITVNISNATASPSPTPTPTDTIPPTVSITSPLNGSTVKVNSKVNISATASDNVGISKVEFSVNNSIKCTISLNLTSYSCNWSVPGKKNTNYTIKVIAYDSSNNNQSASISVKAQ